MALEKASITNTNTNEVIYVMFNPETYSFNKSNSFNEIAIPGLDSPIIQYSKGNTRTLSLDLFFDSYEKSEDVRIYTKKIEQLLYTDDTKAPPVCIFTWGSFTFKCVVESVNSKYEMFLSSGVPVRANLSISLKEYEKVDQQISFSSTVSNISEIEHVVKSGETIQEIAQEILGDCKKWRDIAQNNNIYNPRMIKTGLPIKIPQKINQLKNQKNKINQAKSKLDSLKKYNPF